MWLAEKLDWKGLRSMLTAECTSPERFQNIIILGCLPSFAYLCQKLQDSRKNHTEHTVCTAVFSATFFMTMFSSDICLPSSA